ncbi:MAG: LacI family DNA-binding transcriptional regulator [bacterium]|jgi:LacI family transcriptional regulator|nr:LacI family DNA-binding transcriptional regulator [bacterium]MDD4153152.1 LacI family DNA-binding transcriptional regulator [bacterium]MDD4558268.1 LacI family DNA-binding transcriptional regulator [bacterium]
MSRQSTLKEISQYTGIPLSTVAAVLREDPKCFAGPKLRQQIMAAAHKLNYRPNPIARSLRTGKSNTIGLILPNTRIPVMQENLEIIEDLTQQKGYRLFIGYTHMDIDREESLLTDFVNRYVDGIIIASVQSGPCESYLQQLIEKNYPLVSISRNVAFNPASVYTDYFKGGQLAAEYMMAQGHHKLAVFTEDTGERYKASRTDGFVAIASKAGLGVEFLLVRDKDGERCKFDNRESLVRKGYELADDVLSRPNRPTAVFAGNDDIALGVIRAALQLGIKVPEELSVIGFDDSDTAVLSPVALTSVRQNSEEIGCKSVDILLDMIDKKLIKEAPPVISDPVLIEPKLVVRASTGPAPK